jgi:uncharacterized protein YtpQ (UPF0354 family)
MSLSLVTSKFRYVRVTSTTFLPVLVPVDGDPLLEQLLLDEFLGNLAVGYALGPPFGDRLVTWADLDRLQLSRRVVRREAAAVLDGSLNRVRLHGQPPALMLSFDGPESSVLLADPFWDDLEGSVPGELVVGCPARDVVIVTGANSRVGLEKARRAVDRVFFAGDQHLLTRHLLVRRRGQWDVFRPSAPRQRTSGSSGPPR